MNKKNIKTKDILGGKPKGKDHPNYTKALAVKTPASENFRVVNPITGKTADIVLHRDGTTDETLAMVLLSPDATKEQKDSFVSNWMFERGKENASFLAELYISKGTHIKETQAFKRQIRFDFESFANVMVLLLHDLADDIKRTRMHGAVNTFDTIAERLQKGADLLTKQREKITEARMREKGYGVYLDRNGQAYSIFDDEIESAIKNDKEQIKNESENREKNEEGNS